MKDSSDSRETIDALLENPEPVDLDRIERALADRENRDATQEAALSALVWHRRTVGRHGILGALLYPDCAERVGVMAHHLDAVGADDAAAAMRALRAEIALEDTEIRHGLADWIELNPEAIARARELDAELTGDVAAPLWQFLRRHRAGMGDVALPPRWQSFWSRLFQ